MTERALLFTDVVDSTRLVERLGDACAAEVWAAHDRRARDLVARHHGREIGRADGIFLLFDDPADAARYALDYHGALADLALSARAGLHVGAVTLRENTPEDVAQGAIGTEVEGLAMPVTARVMALACGGQTMLTAAARAHLVQALVIHRAVGNRRAEGATLGGLGELLAREGRFAEARELLRSGEALLREVGDQLELANLLCDGANVELAAGDVVAARTALASAETVAQAMGARLHSEVGGKIDALRRKLA